MFCKQTNVNYVAKGNVRAVAIFKFETCTYIGTIALFLADLQKNKSTK